MNSEEKRLKRLLDLARRAPIPAREDDESTFTPPLGFATRVAARWASSPRTVTAADIWERLSWWGSGVAVATCMIVFAIQQRQPEPSAFDLLLDVTQETQPF
jgi:hypothetical protein